MTLCVSDTTLAFFGTFPRVPPLTCATAELCLSCEASSPRDSCRHSFFTCRTVHGNYRALGPTVRPSSEMFTMVITVSAMIPLLYHVFSGRTSWYVWRYRWPTVADISRCLFCYCTPRSRWSGRCQLCDSCGAPPAPQKQSRPSVSGGLLGKILFVSSVHLWTLETSSLCARAWKVVVNFREDDMALCSAR